ncbi:MAG: hypothetical protein PHH54_05180 [Candidatus Nanoarchaeia archaeon]|nr:hypothetical protein [Candidatus Nanoarchaeia archaeon]MDD5741351.1 hypothetical protein [Candidatus Nanoarchaeia archaeon]
MAKGYQPEQGGHFNDKGEYINKYGKRDDLMGMAIIGSNLGKAPLPKPGNWAKVIGEEYETTGGSSQDLSLDLEELEQIFEEHKNKR